MNIPDSISNRWASTLDDATLVVAEAQLHTHFNTQDAAEKARLGTRYRLLQGPTELVNAWLRWRTVNNEALKRGLLKHRS